MTTATTGGVVCALATHFLFATGILYRGVSMGTGRRGNVYTQAPLGWSAGGGGEGRGRTGDAVEGLWLGLDVGFLLVLHPCERGIHGG